MYRKVNCVAWGASLLGRRAAPAGKLRRLVGCMTPAPRPFQQQGAALPSLHVPLFLPPMPAILSLFTNPSSRLSLPLTLLGREARGRAVQEPDRVVQRGGDEHPHCGRHHKIGGPRQHAVEGVTGGGQGGVESVHDAEPEAYSLLPEEDQVPEVPQGQVQQEEHDGHIQGVAIEQAPDQDQGGGLKELQGDPNEREDDGAGGPRGLLQDPVVPAHVHLGAEEANLLAEEDGGGGREDVQGNEKPGIQLSAGARRLHPTPHRSSHRHQQSPLARCTEREDREGIPVQDLAVFALPRGRPAGVPAEESSPLVLVTKASLLSLLFPGEMRKRPASDSPKSTWKMREASSLWLASCLWLLAAAAGLALLTVVAFPPSQVGLAVA